jgi:hypothetical protein
MRTPGSGEQAEILALLCTAAEPLSTAQVRARVNAGRADALVGEQVYRRLQGLLRRKLVTAPRRTGTRDVYWQAAARRREAG